MPETPTPQPQSIVTAGPWIWQRFGKEWCLVAQDRRRSIVLDVGGRPTGLRQQGLGAQRGLMVPFQPDHPDARLLAGAWDLSEALGSAVDRVENLLGALKLPLSPALHLQGLTEGLQGLRSELRAAYAAARSEADLSPADLTPAPEPR